MNELRIKVCGMRQPDNIRQLLALKPDYIGFIFYPKSQRFVDHIDEDVLNAIPSSVKKTGVFVDADEDLVLERIQSFKLNALQLHGSESPAFCRAMQSQGIEVIKAFGIDASFDFRTLTDYEDCVDYFLFDTKTQQHGGSGKTFNWSLLGDYKLSIPFFLSGGLDADNIKEALKIEDERFCAIDLNSRFEIQPGFKDIEKLRVTINDIKHIRAQA